MLLSLYFDDENTRYYYCIRSNCIAAIYENIAISIATSQAGTTVVNLRPTPNCRSEPSLLYINPGLAACMIVYDATNIVIAIKTRLFLTNVASIIMPIIY